VDGKPQRPPAAVYLEGITRSFVEGGKRQLILDGISARIESGESVALRGRSGSGKSTLLNIISGIDQPDGGVLRVAGTDLTAASERERTQFRRQHIGFVYQAFNLVPNLSVADNIRLVLELNGVAEAAASARIDELLDAVGLADRARAHPDVLSGGEQQRVAIARAVAHRPRLVLADEPTGNLDERTAESVLKLLTALLGEQGATLIMATHSATVAAGCDRIVEIQNGKLSEIAAPVASS